MKLVLHIWDPNITGSSKYIGPFESFIYLDSGFWLDDTKFRIPNGHLFAVMNADHPEAKKWSDSWIPVEDL